MSLAGTIVCTAFCLTAAITLCYQDESPLAEVFLAPLSALGPFALHISRLRVGSDIEERRDLFATAKRAPEELVAQPMSDHQVKLFKTCPDKLKANVLASSWLRIVVAL